MLRNFSRAFLVLAAGWLAAAPALRAQTAAPLRGDVDGDGKVTEADARIVADFLVGRPVPATADVAGRGDVNGDGRVSAADVAIIRAYAAGRDVSRFPVAHPAPAANGDLISVRCSADVKARTVSCGDPALAGGARADVIVGGQNQYVKLASGAVTMSGDTMSFGVTLQNLLPQAIGTTDGTTPDANGVRVFFSSGPVVTTGTGMVTVANANGMDTFTGTNQPYFTYGGANAGPDGILSPGETSGSVTWQLVVPASVGHFDFLLYVNAPVQFQDGWVDLYPPSHPKSPSLVPSNTLSAGQTLQVDDTVRNAVGKTVPGAPITWTTTGHGAITVSSSGLVTAVADGVDSVIATSGNRTGRMEIVVSTASPATTTITPNPATLNVGDSSTITVQAKNGAGTNITTGGATVTLAASVGTLTPVVDHNNGTYTAKLTSTTSGVVKVSGTLNGVAIHDTASVTFNPGAPATLAVHSANPQTGTAGLPAGSPPGALVTDSHGNPVPGVLVQFRVTAGGGKLSDGGPAADSVQIATGSNGIATVTSWTLGNTAGTSNNTVVASSAGLTSVTYTASADPGPPANMVKSAGDAQSAPVGTAVTTAPAVTITDAHNNPVPGVSVTFAVASGGGSVTGSPATTNASGVATAGSWTLGTTTGANTLKASSTGLTDVTFTATGTPGLPANIAKTAGDGQTANVGSAVTTAPAVHVTDQYGNAVPGATINFTVTGGGGSVTVGSPTTDASGNAAVGSWTLGAGPTTNTLQAAATTGSATPASFIGYVPPTVVTDNSQAMGNTTLPSNVAPNVLSNDVTINGPGSTISITTTGAITTARGGTVTLAADGSFSYLPAAGVTGRDSAQYTINDTHASASGYIKFAFVGKVWHIDSGYGGGNGAPDGRDVSPFTSVSAAEAVAGVNDTMLVSTGSGTTGGGTLKNGQILRGQGQNAAFTATLNAQTVTLLPTGTAPNVGALTLASGNSLRGFRVFNASGSGLTGASIGTLSIGEMSIGVTGGAALDLSSGTVTGNGGSGAAVLDSVRSTNSSTSGVALSGVNGTLTVNGGLASTIVNPTGSAVSINGSSPTFTFPGTISKTNGGGTGISLTSTGATVSFTGPSVVLSTGASNGVNMSSATGTVSFVDSVKITTTSGNGISASNGGTLTVTGAHNSITSGTGTALNVSSTTIGAAGLTFRSISASGGSNGIVLSSTGTSGGLTVTGDGATNGSGGTIANTTGGDGASAGNGVYLSSAQNVSLSWMALSGHQNHAVYGTSAKNVDLNHVRITGNNGSSNSGTFQEGAVHFVNATGGITVKNSRLDGSAYTAFLVEQLAGSPAADSVVAAFDTVSTGQGSTSDVRGQALQTIVTSGSANVRYRNNSVTYWWGTGIEVAVQNTAGSSTALIQNNRVNQTSGALNAAGGIEVSGGALAFNISGNNVTGTDGTAISVDRAQGNTLLNGTIDGNTIGTSGVANSGSATGTGIFVQHAGPSTTTVKVSNNTIRQVNGSQAIWFLLGDDTGGGGVGTMNVTATGNNIAEEGTASTVRTGIVLESGRVTNDTDTMCIDVQSNSITNFNNRIRPNERFHSTMHVRGYTGANNDNTAMASYLVGLNPGTAVVASNNVSAGGPGYSNTSPAGSACAQPTM